MENFKNRDHSEIIRTAYKYCDTGYSSGQEPIPPPRIPISSFVEELLEEGANVGFEPRFLRDE